MATLKPLRRKFYARPTQLVAKELLGKVLVRQLHHQIISGRITEVEAYVGEDDLACHAARGRTTRTDIMYGEAGYAYIYLIYGMYHCLNIVTEQKNFPAAVLIRALEPLEGIAQMQRERTAPRAGKTPGVWDPLTPGVKEARGNLKSSNIYSLTNGPGKLAQALQITRELNGEYLTKSTLLYVVDDGFVVKSPDIATSPRIGVAYAGACALYPWRYYLKDSAFISRK